MAGAALINHGGTVIYQHVRVARPPSPPCLQSAPAPSPSLVFLNTALSYSRHFPQVWDSIVRGGLNDLTWGGFARLTRWRASTRGEQPPGPPLGLFKGGVPACGARRFRLVLSRLVQLRLVQRNCLRRAERCSDLKRCRGGIRVTVDPCSGRASKKKVGS